MPNCLRLCLRFVYLAIGSHLRYSCSHNHSDEWTNFVGYVSHCELTAWAIASALKQCQGSIVKLCTLCGSNSTRVSRLLYDTRIPLGSVRYADNVGLKSEDDRKNKFFGQEVCMGTSVHRFVLIWFFGFC